jgi:hypothetical protein
LIAQQNVAINELKKENTRNYGIDALRVLSAVMIVMLHVLSQGGILAASADLTDEKNYKKFCDSVDIQSLMDYVTVETYINNSDWANGVSNNWEAWHAKTVNPDLPKADGKWRFILYDTEFSSGLYGSESTQYKYDLLNSMSVGEEDFDIPDILRNACKNETFRQAFYDNYLHIMETCFDSDTVSKKTDEYAAAYGAATKDTFFRFGMD